MFWYNSETTRESEAVRRSRKSANPFYVLLIIAGLSFAMTATAYVVMAFREAHAREETIEKGGAAVASSDEHPLMVWMRHHGDTALLSELGLLAICTFAAIGSDSYWQRRADVRQHQPDA
jgi:hypothetical protein